MQLGSQFHAHIAEMPGLVNNAGLFRGTVGIPDDKAILVAILSQPLLNGLIALLAIQTGILAVGNIHRKTGLMLAGAGCCNALDGLFIGNALIELIIQQRLVLVQKNILKKSYIIECYLLYILKMQTNEQLSLLN